MSYEPLEVNIRKYIIQLFNIFDAERNILTKLALKRNFVITSTLYDDATRLPTGAQVIIRLQAYIKNM